MEQKLLDIIIIGKNEEKTLSYVFSSVKEASNNFELIYKSSPRILYVDSNSTDNSIHIAKEYNIDFIILNGKTSPGIGRHAGALKTYSKYIFFLDGDSCVDENWLIKGVEFLESNPAFAGVGGKLVFKMFNQKGELIWEDLNYRAIKKPIRQIYDGVGGTFLYRRDCYIKSGGFSEILRVGEEFDLLIKMASRGDYLYRINVPMAVHFDYKTEKENFVKRYLVTNNIFVPGVICRKAFANKRTILIFIKRYWLHFIHIPFIFSAIILLILQDFVLGMLLLSSLLFFHLLYKGFSLKRGFVSFFTMFFYSGGLYCGLLIKGTGHNP